MTVKKSLVTIVFEFFKPVDLEDLERNIRELVKRKRFPPFAKMTPMVSYKNMKQISGRPYPLLMRDKRDIP